MNTIEELKQDVQAKKADLEAAKFNHTQARRLLAEAKCPYKVGETTTVKGHAFAGKQCQITGIGIDESWRNSDWRVVATLFKKDGTLGATTVVWSEQDEPKKGTR